MILLIDLCSLYTYFHRPAETGGVGAIALQNFVDVNKDPIIIRNDDDELGDAQSNLQGGAKRMDSLIFKSGDYNFNLIASIW